MRKLEILIAERLKEPFFNAADPSGCISFLAFPIYVSGARNRQKTRHPERRQ
jgi:hypothetical protein